MVQSIPYTDLSVCIFIILLFILFHKYGNVSLLVGLIVVLGLFLYWKTTDLSEGMDQVIAQYRDTVDSPQILQKPVELVIARYNETLHWLNTDPFYKYPIVIYNKGDPMVYDLNAPGHMEILPNVGKCDHTYLYHIIKNYDNLADVTVFLPGSATMKTKIGKTKKLMSFLETEPNKTVFLFEEYFTNINKIYNFHLDNWKTSNELNNIKNPESALHLSKIRPFGKWFEKHFPKININHISLMGIMAISKEDIQQHPKRYYENLIKELETSSNPEAGHYIERAWEAVFYPMKTAQFIKV